MINSNELRIGNLLLMHDPDSTDHGLTEDEMIVEVIRIRPTQIEVHSKQFQFWDVQLDDEEGLHAIGIPLTRESLSSTGFHQRFTTDPQDDNAGEAYFIDDFVLHTLTGSLKFFFHATENRLIEVKFLHELQNIYFFLIKKELEVTNAG